jgi:hypothetical protein
MHGSLSPELTSAHPRITGGSAKARSELRVVSQALRQLYPLGADASLDDLLWRLDRSSKKGRCW